ncbi:type I-E CRISPR-associated endonuclease Cas1e [Aquidulcibacter paucihalophilus]|uniref:type I-E CRISPR-associated endonuclease Cas1e n=1 Tax=Aquidulcibacter paucihalophilus TaxID=1978549 RepID=UPI000A197F8C|nr:type I-E CRISPR-associated endonuclease Cas1e [Aquidulcibacter paucihalophilus]
MLSGRLGLETARIPHDLRHGLLYLDRGRLEVENGCLRFMCAGGGAMERGDWQIPHQAVTLILLGPGSSVTHDALRILARHNTGLAAVGEGGVRFYTAPPLLPDASARARQHARTWADPDRRLHMARRMYAWRLGEVLPVRDIAALRGIEGARMKESYKLIAQQVGVKWRGRHYDRGNPTSTDAPNQALNHAASAIEGAAAIAVACTATIPQLGFIHEDSGQAFVLDIADLYRNEITIPVAFAAARDFEKQTTRTLESLTRRACADALRRRKTISSMIERIKAMFDSDKGGEEAIEDPSLPLVEGPYP